MGVFGWDYPPGVTGNESAITGESPCVDCGMPLAECPSCPSCGGELDWNDEKIVWECPSCKETFDGDACVGGCRDER